MSYMRSLQPSIKNIQHTSKHENSLLFSIFVDFFPPGSGSGSSDSNKCGSMRIRIHNPAFDDNSLVAVGTSVIWCSRCICKKICDVLPPWQAEPGSWWCRRRWRRPSCRGCRPPRSRPSRTSGHQPRAPRWSPERRAVGSMALYYIKSSLYFSALIFWEENNGLIV